MPSRLLSECGEALYGPRWQSDLARDLGVSIRTMQRWVAGDFEMPDGVWGELRGLVVARKVSLDAVLRRLSGG